MNMEKYLNIAEIFQWKIINSNEIPFSQMVIDACKANQCGMYNACWTCPPGVGTQEMLEKCILNYEKAAVFTCKFMLEDCFDYEGMTVAREKTQNVINNIIDRIRDSGEDFMALGCGGCNICPKCTYPEKPCRFPEKAIISVEACGINVVELSKKCEINYNNGINTVTYFSIILFN